MNINLTFIRIFTLSAALTITSLTVNAATAFEVVSAQQQKTPVTSVDNKLIHAAGVSDIEGKAETINEVVASKTLTKQQNNTPLARALAQSESITAENPLNEDKTLNLAVTELKDNSGLVYLGGKVSAADLDSYLAQMKTELGESQFNVFRQHQAARDHQTFHVTLVNPYEYQTIDKENFEMPRQFRVVLHGLGQVENEDKDKKAYFVVASSPDGQFIRQGLLLKNKDFHVTLGFYPEDVFGVSKGRDSLINK